jgi:hypothetical protein
MNSTNKMRINSIQGIAKVVSELRREDKTGPDLPEGAYSLASPPQLQRADYRITRSSARDAKELTR